LPRRQWGVFTVTVPKDFGAKKLIWTLAANGVTTTVPAHLDPLWEISPFRDTNGNTPPFIGLEAQGPFVNGPQGPSLALTTNRETPLPLPVWVADDAHLVPGAPRPAAPPVTLSWSKFRGSGAVTFGDWRPPVQPLEFPAPPTAAFRGKAVTTATFSQPGEYVLRVVANDWTGDGGRGFQCCWSNAWVKVLVKD
jgi:hypothetical protein